MTKNISMREWEALSAYLDGELPAKERTKMEARLNQAPELRSALEEMRHTRAVLRSQPKVRAPRNFTLTPEMVGLTSRPPRRAPAYPFFRLASALAGFLFLLVLVGDLTGLPARVGLPGAAQPTLVAMAPEAAPVENAPRLMQAYPEPSQEADQAQSFAPKATQGPMKLMAPQTSTPEPNATPELPMSAMSVPPSAESTPFGMAGGGPPPTNSVTEAPAAQAATIAPASPATQDHAYPTPSSPAQSLGLSPLRIVELVLALLAVGSGLIALVLRRIGSA